MNIKKLIKRYIFIVLIIISIIFSFQILPISDLKSFLPNDIYLKYIWSERISMLAYNILLLTIIAQNIFNEQNSSSIAKKVAFILAFFVVDIILVWL